MLSSVCIGIWVVAILMYIITFICVGEMLLETEPVLGAIMMWSVVALLLTALAFVCAYCYGTYMVLIA